MSRTKKKANSQVSSAPTKADVSQYLMQLTRAGVLAYRGLDRNGADTYQRIPLSKRSADELRELEETGRLEFLRRFEETGDWSEISTAARSGAFDHFELSLRASPKREDNQSGSLAEAAIPPSMDELNQLLMRMAAAGLISHRGFSPDGRFIYEDIPLSPEKEREIDVGGPLRPLFEEFLAMNRRVELVQKTKA